MVICEWFLCAFRDLAFGKFAAQHNFEIMLSYVSPHLNFVTQNLVSLLTKSSDSQKMVGCRVEPYKVVNKALPYNKWQDEVLQIG